MEERTAAGAGPAAQGQGHGEVWLFWSCFIALIATAFGFIIRSLIIDDWARDFGLTETQKGEILGVGLWPFAVSIVLFSLIIDRIGYGRAMVFAFACHVASAFLTIFARNYAMLYAGTFIVALGNGTVEAVINPVVATMFSRAKTQWLNILHAGWPGGLVLGGVITLSMGDAPWKFKVALILIPTIVYGLMMFGRRFPIHERVAAGVSYRAMLQELGIVGALIIVALMVREVGRFFAWGDVTQIMIIVAAVVAYGLYVRSLGRPMFIFLLLVMLPLATTELGTDTWITDLLAPIMRRSGWVLVYTSFIMMVLRFCAGPIVHRISPLGLLALSAAIAAVGLFSLSLASGLGIFLAATLYGLGKTFFWPTTLGVVAERFPRGGALTLNTIAGVGMLGVGILGSVFIGQNQDTRIDRMLAERNPQLHGQVQGEARRSVFGEYRALEPEKVSALGAAQKEEIQTITAEAKKRALSTVAVLPVIMFICYVILILYFRGRGGYRALDIREAEAAGSGPARAG